MSDTYVSKVNDKPLAASEAAPSSAIDNKLKDLKNRWNDNHGNMRTSSSTSAVWAKLATVTYPSGLDGENAIYGKIMLHQYATTKLAANFSLLFPSGALAICNGNFTSGNIGNIKLGFVINTTNRTVDLYGYISGHAYSGIRLIIDDITRYNGTTVEATVQYYKDATLLSSEPSGIVYCDNDNGAVQTNIADYVKYQRTNEINYKNVPTSGNKNRHWFNYRNGDTGDPDPNNMLSAYYFGNRNYSTDGVYLNAEGFTPTCITGLSGTSGKNFVPFAKFTLTNTGSAQGFVNFRCVVMRANTDDYIGLVDILVKIRQNSWHAVAMKCVRGGNDSIDEYGSFCDGVYWTSNNTTVYLGVRTSSFSSKVSVFVQNMPLNTQNAPLNGTGSFTLGDYTSEVSSLTEQTMYTRDLVLARALYGTSGERMAFAYNPSALGSGSPVADAEAYWAALAQRTVQVAYNNRGMEYTLFFSKAVAGTNGNYGSILRWGYNAPYLEMLRVHQSNWMSDDWETICPPSVLCFEYTTDTSEMEALAKALTYALKTRKVGSSSEYKNRKPIVFLHKSGYYYMLTYQGGGGSSGSGTHMWRFQHAPYDKQDSATNGYALFDTWSGDTHTYSWSNISSVSFTGDLRLKTSQDTYFASSGNATIEITDNNSLYYAIMMNGSAVFTLDTDSEATVHTLLVCRHRTSDICAEVTIQWRSMTGVLQEMRVFDYSTTQDNNHEIVFDVWIRRVSAPGGSTYAIATVTPQAPRFVSLLEDKSNWGYADTTENGVFGMKPYYFNS